MCLKYTTTLFGVLFLELGWCGCWVFWIHALIIVKFSLKHIGKLNVETDKRFSLYFMINSLFKLQLYSSDSKNVVGSLHNILK